MAATDSSSRSFTLPDGLRPARLFHILTWIRTYSGADFRGDLVAGLTVGVMLVPQGMAYAVLAGVEPVFGLYASLVPLLVYPIFGTSRHLAVGIMALDMLILSAGIADKAEIGSAEYVQLALTTALMVGVLQMIMGVARLGFLVNLLSRPVISGFTAAAALTIGVSQVGNLSGLNLPPTPDIFILLADAASRLSEVHLITLTLGGAGILVLIVLRRFVPVAPGPLIVVVMGTALVWLVGLGEQGVEVVGEVPTGLPTPTLPDTSVGMLRELLPTAITLALVQFMTVISLGKVFAAKHRYTVGANRELFALGALNVMGSVFRSLPVSGSFSRSAVGDRAGTRTALSNVAAAFVVIVTLLFLTPLFYFLPIPVLASIIIVAAFGMIDLRELKFLLRAKKVDGGIAILTFLATLVIGIQEGVLIGIAASVTAIMYRISRPYVAVLGHLPGTRSFRDVRRNPDAEIFEGILILRVDASFSFANAEFLQDLILKESQPEDHRIQAVVIDASSINDLDTTAAAVLTNVTRTLKARGVNLFFGGVKARVREVMARCGLEEMLGDDHFFLSPHRAVIHVLTSWGKVERYLDTVPEKRDPKEKSVSNDIDD